MSITHGESTYRYTEEAHGHGTFFYTDCCNNRMYSVNNDPMHYHGKLCPRCFMDNKYVTLYMRGTEDGIRVFNANVEGSEEDERYV